VAVGGMRMICWKGPVPAPSSNVPPNIGLFKTLATSWHSNLQRRAAPDPPKFFNYDFFIVKLILA
jgi:hypothetical protein